LFQLIDEPFLPALPSTQISHPTSTKSVFSVPDFLQPPIP
jgi:hypothetical protein